MDIFRSSLNHKKSISVKYILGLVLAVTALILFLRSPILDVFGGAVSESGEVKVHFIDVGQADCILLQSQEETMLIDAGDNEDAETVIAYLHKLGITKLDYVVATHGHIDHIGSMDAIIENFEIDKFYMPTQIYQTQSYQQVLDSVKKKGINIIRPHFKETKAFGNAEFTFITPDAQEDYADLNDSSIGIRVTDNSHSFLFCGDISREMEKTILKSKVYLQSDVIKVSHHGSGDTSSYAFLKKVDPEYAVISCGQNNDFGHPHKKTLRTLKKLDIQLFRTDEQGTIIFTSSGGQLTCNVNPIWE